MNIKKKWGRERERPKGAEKREEAVYLYNDNDKW